MKMHTISIRIVMIFILLIPLIIFSQDSNEKIRIGTFDSRCVAIAYGRTDFLKLINGMRAELKTAKEEGNEERVAELEKLGSTYQFLMHQQGFSTGSAKNIMDSIKDKLPSVAEKNKVKLILSKWEVFYNDDSLELVDVTDEIVNLFNPDEQSLEIVKNIKGMDPVPIEQISTDPHE
ncbi:hypothetical protein HQ585_07265 [candidate division KSB1 bacterium]|nr:hypothetical protein [candidate division KSB1 bacterium]